MPRRRSRKERSNRNIYGFKCERCGEKLSNAWMWEGYCKFCKAKIDAERARGRPEKQVLKLDASPKEVFRRIFENADPPKPVKRQSPQN